MRVAAPFGPFPEPARPFLMRRGGMNATGNETIRGNPNNVGSGGMAGIGVGGGAAVLVFVLLFGAWAKGVSGRYYCCHVRGQIVAGLRASRGAMCGDMRLPARLLM
jgi:hypothetical protein